MKKSMKPLKAVCSWSMGLKPVLCLPVTKPQTQQTALFPMRALSSQKAIACAIYFNRTK